ncbi:MAG: hypothetical protein ACREMY_03795, partial [bacterium]
AKRWGLPTSIPPSVLSLVSAATIWGVLYWVFDRFAWRWRLLARLLGVPNLAGDWLCEGVTLSAEGAPWQGRVAITQTWDRIRVRLKTEQSGSNSISAALLRDPIDGYILLYHYQNDPHVDQPQLRSHHGFAELTFSKDLRRAEGEYFNGHGRYTWGTMKLTRS